MNGESTTRPRLAAFAPTDCHTCLSRNRRCERQRPYCSTCLDKGLKCGGYATALSWHECRTYSSNEPRLHHQQRREQMLEQRLASQSQQDRANVSPIISATENARTFRFVGPRSRRAKKTRKTSNSQQTRSPIAQQSVPPDTACGFTTTVNVDSFLGSFPSENYEENDPGDIAVRTVPMKGTSRPWTSFEIETCPVPDRDSAFAEVADPGTVAALSPSNLTFDPDNSLAFEWPDLGPDDGQAMLDILPSTFSLSNHVGWPKQEEVLLKYYDTVLCVLPLTSDMALNPFRIKGFAPEDSQLLLRSVSALSSQHQVNVGNVQSSEASENRAQAYNMLSRTLQNQELSNSSSCVLAAILILMTLDCTISALGNWSDHIRRAGTVFEAWGGPSSLNTPRLRSQASMLVWWDATLAMISRQGMRLGSSYFQHLVRTEKEDGWSFYEITGCPTELLVHLVRLAEMARQREIAESMEFLTFDIKPVLDIEKQLLDWNHGLEDERMLIHREIVSLEDENESVDTQSAGTSEADDNEEDYRRRRDDHHCAEAWRYALLLYIQRVFRWDRRSHRRPPAILPLTCKVFEHSRNCRKTSQVQKQLLLPIFLAGAEARDKDMRDTVRAYCVWWGARSRYGMFYSVSSLLEEFWTGVSSKDGDPVWWGSFLDAKSNSEKVGDVAAMQFLFG
ncbi:uncharacterized protein Z518_03564 [Rhinocladiella mackenziei CBS 650.93]|uniref:Zn(2)-C6 fungal-type domain-containing protein n=1 Tax=Rhinocladiella mackenziei CBS 650.93 TaxID=1442369 RepID=A0A0D2G2Y5_9EURO|nr:uncharacterized protein Z518_03564 [Rhinocladiella mackenziei CBS 650.93]KIX08907.1 hypothetical protein Z518_03564 [Rhinocladiella mackenziei CBS 650.93]